MAGGRHSHKEKLTGFAIPPHDDAAKFSRRILLTGCFLFRENYAGLHEEINRFSCHARRARNERDFFSFPDERNIHRRLSNSP